MATPTAKAIGDYFSARTDALTAATRAGLRQSGEELAKEANRQLGGNFSRRAGRAKARYYPARGALPDASIVSIKPKFLSVFEEGATIQGAGYLVIPIPPFRRVGKRGWGATYQALKARFDRVAILREPDGYLILADGKPAYKLQRQAKIPKRLDLRGLAKRLGSEIPDLIENLIRG